MEMSFPHHALRKCTKTATTSDESVLDAARARQAKSRTVRAMRHAEHGQVVDPDDLVARIHCFASEPDAETTVRGSFWQNTEAAKMDEDAVYQSDSANIKVQPLSPSGTGTDLNRTGHGAEKSYD
jgi:hypothetical protein